MIVDARNEVISLEIHQLTLTSFKCVDVTLAEPEEVEEVTKDNCYNSTNIGFGLVFTTSALEGAASVPTPPSGATALFAISVALMIGSAWL
jgi:hypothetical protein